MEELGKILCCPLNDGTLILYVNNAIQDTNTELRRLMHDFSCVDPEDMYSQELAERTRFFKNTEEGRSIMSSVWKEAQEEAERRGAEKATQQEKEATAIRMLKNGESEEKTVLYSTLPLAIVQKLAHAVALGSL